MPPRKRPKPPAARDAAAVTPAAQVTQVMDIHPSNPTALRVNPKCPP